MADPLRMKENLSGKTCSELQEICTVLGLPGRIAGELACRLYKKKVLTLDEMSGISKQARLLLGQNHTLEYQAFLNEEISADGTRKFLFPAGRGRHIETALIPEGKRVTLCVSTQVGCRMGCSICRTSRQGFQGNLSVSEILNQVIMVSQVAPVTHIVFMGMGEPLDNLDAVLPALEIITSGYGMAISPRNVTVSTVGLMPEIHSVLEKSRCNIALSLLSPYSEERAKYIPAEKRHPFRSILEILRSFPVESKRRFSIAYVMIRGLNDSDMHLGSLIGLLHGSRLRVNLIPYHPLPGSDHEPSGSSRMHHFFRQLNERGVPASIRKSRGYDIAAACGLLSTSQKS